MVVSGCNLQGMLQMGLKHK